MSFFKYFIGGCIAVERVVVIAIVFDRLTLCKPSELPLFEGLGDLCLDESLDYDFWMTGDYGMGDLISIVQKLFESLVVQVKAAQTFR